MSDDLVKYLRGLGDYLSSLLPDKSSVLRTTVDAAINEIERLRAELDDAHSDGDRWRKIAEDLATGVYNVSYGRLRDALDKYERASTDG